MNKICKHCGEVIHRDVSGRLWHNFSVVFPQYCRFDHIFRKGLSIDEFIMEVTELGGNLHEPEAPDVSQEKDDG